MKSQIRKTEAEMARYSEEYKQQAVERWRSSGRSAEASRRGRRMWSVVIFRQ